MIRISGLSVPFSDVRPLEEIAAERLSLRRDSVLSTTVVRRAVDAIKLPNRDAIKLPNFKLPNRERKR